MIDPRTLAAVRREREAAREHRARVLFSLICAVLLLLAGALVLYAEVTAP